MSNKLTKMAIEILQIEADLPHRLDYTENSCPTLDDFEIYSFDQTWGSTSLGFDGIGGQAITTARTYVFVPISGNQMCFVYFGGKFAYKVPYSQVLIEDIHKQNMAAVADTSKYLLKFVVN